MPFNQQVSFPCELTLRDTRNGLRIFRKPIREIALLHHGQDTWTNRTLHANQVLPLEPSGRLFHIQAKLSIPEGAKLRFNLRGVPVVLTSKTIESGAPPVSLAENINTVEILLDRASLEAFVNDGEVSSTRYILPNENGLSVKAESGTVTIESLTIYPLKSTWTDTAPQDQDGLWEPRALTVLLRTGNRTFFRIPGGVERRFANNSRRGCEAACSTRDRLTIRVRS